MRKAPHGFPPAPWYCYLLECSDGTFYAGITTDPARRTAEHNRGVASRYTRARLPVRLVYAEPHPDRPSATRRERQLKALPPPAKRALAAFHPSG
ncbi:MAG: GIY-YIG nuclease family protein [Deferrisomatales bacterium]|nr:GIY-YIG nuclease family protein [Deferrisomatales bacterium]